MPRDFDGEDVIRYTFDPRTKQWSQQYGRVRLDSEQPLATGPNKIVYSVLDASYPHNKHRCVGKSPKHGLKLTREALFREVEMQARCAEYAAAYNKLRVPKKVRFIQGWICQFVNRPADIHGQPPIMLVEPYLDGEYVKHSNNYGYVNTHTMRNTPHAFSHWSYEVSQEAELIADLQGVKDTFTDPQIHCRQQKGVWGNGDLGINGIMKFFTTHRCNKICHKLALTPRYVDADQAQALPVPSKKQKPPEPTFAYNWKQGGGSDDDTSQASPASRDSRGRGASPRPQSSRLQGLFHLRS